MTPSPGRFPSGAASDEHRNPSTGPIDDDTDAVACRMEIGAQNEAFRRASPHPLDESTTARPAQRSRRNTTQSPCSRLGSSWPMLAIVGGHTTTPAEKGTARPSRFSDRMPVAPLLSCSRLLPEIDLPRGERSWEPRASLPPHVGPRFEPASLTLCRGHDGDPSRSGCQRSALAGIVSDPIGVAHPVRRLRC